MPGTDPGGRLFLVIGCGSIGKRHIANLRALGARQILACDVRPDRIQEAVSQFGVQAVGGLEAAWEHRPDVALITVPTSLHVPLGLEAAARGCHLFIEKPLADRLDGVDRLLGVVRQRRLVTLVGCNMRFHPGLVTTKRLLEDGAVGRIAAVRVEVGHYLPDWHPWEDYRETYSARQDLGGGIILDAIHELDYIRWLVGEVTAVACFSGRLSGLEIDTEDTAALLLRFAGGAIGEVHMDCIQRTYSRTCHVVGTAGTIRWDCAAGEVRCYSVASHDWQVYGAPDGWQPNDMYLDEMRHFLECLAGAARPAQDAEAARRVLEIALAAKRSADEGVVVALDSPGSRR